MLQETLEKFFHYKSFKKNQKEVIANILAKNNTFMIAPTGGGKSLCYQLPALLMEGMAIVVSPLIALMKSQVDFLNSKNIPAGFLNSTLSKKKVEALKKAIQKKELKLLYIAPETLNKEDTIGFLKTVSISFLAIDEAHCISDWGHDFRPEYRKIKHTLQHLGGLPIIALTATATPQVQQDIVQNLRIKDDVHIFISSFDRPNLYYEVASKHHLERKLIQFIKRQDQPIGIIYCQSRKKAETITEFLKQNHISATVYHAGLDSKVRAKHQDDFLANRVDIVVATIAFGMGVDKPNVRFVIHCDTPKSLEGYYQETGRAGRDGTKAHCLLFYSKQDIDHLRKLSREKLVAQRKSIIALLQHMQSYAELGVCRRKQILHYFGEAYTGMCHNCDNCIQPRPTYEGKNYLMKVLQAVQLTGEIFDMAHLSKVLNGIDDAEIVAHQHHTLPMFNSKMKETENWSSVIAQALLAHYIETKEDEPTIIKLTPLGIAFIQKPYSIRLCKNHAYEQKESENIDKKERIDTALLRLLESLRAQEAIRHHLKPNLIFSQTILERMATDYPTTFEMLRRMPGVGLHKAKKFGKAFIQCIANYMKKHHIQHEEAIIVRQNASKFAHRVYIIQQIDRKIDLETIAKKRKLSFPALIQELENICASGVKLDLHYYTAQWLDEEQQEDLYDYFHASTTDIDNIDMLYDDLCPEYSEEQVRLLRVQFLYEVAN